MTWQLSTVLTGKELKRATLLLDRYERIRIQFSLPLIRETTTADGVQIEFRDPPIPLDLRSANRILAARAIGYLARLERSAQIELADALLDDELSFDETRQAFAIGPALFVPSGSRNVFETLATVCSGKGKLPTTGKISSYTELAVILGRDQPDLDLHLNFDVSPEERIRELHELAIRQMDKSAHALALTHAQAALQLRPHDSALAEIAAEAALRLGDIASFRSVLPALRKRGTHRPHTCFLLSKAAVAEKRYGEALNWAARAVKGAVDRALYWKQFTLAANHAGDREHVLEGLERLAQLGDEQSLAQLRKARGPAATFPVLDVWSGPMTPNVFRWRIEQFHEEEKLRELLLLFGDNRNLWLELEPRHFDHVIEAASRMPGRLLAVRRTLAQEIDTGEASDQTAAAYARTCMLDGLWDRVLDVHHQCPGVVPRQNVLRAFLELDRYEQVLAMAIATNSNEAPYCVLAMVRRALVYGKTAPGHLLSAAVARCFQAGHASQIQREHEHLICSGPTLPITIQFGKILEKQKQQ